MKSEISFGDLLTVDLGGARIVAGPKGERGDQGPRGDAGVGIASAELQDDYTLLLNLDDGSSYTLGPIRGERGEKGERGEEGARGEAGASLTEIRLKAGNHAAGTSDTYEAVLTDGLSGGTFEVYNGRDGTGAGDMVSSVYDPEGRRADIFAELDGKLGKSGGEVNGDVTLWHLKLYNGLLEDNYTDIYYHGPDNKAVVFANDKYGDHRLRGIESPEQDNDAATKAYVDAERPKYYTGKLLFQGDVNDGELVLSGMPEEYGEDRHLVTAAPKTVADTALWREHGVYLREIQNIGATDWALKFTYDGYDMGKAAGNPFSLNVGVAVQRMEAGA